MRSSFTIGWVGDIEVGVHYSWFLVFILVAWTLAAGLFPFQLPGLGAGVYWAMGIASSLLLFVSVLIHELAHSLVAEARGLRVRSIILFIFGGVSNISGEPGSAPDELLIAAVGPISSLVMGGVFWLIWFGTGGGVGPISTVLLYLAGINVLLAVFNLIPGFPLDGGRVLRAIVWWVSGSMLTATRIAVAAGHVVAFVFILGGLFIVFAGAFLSGIWLMIIGWFLNGAAEASGREAEESERLRGIRVRDVMNPNPATVRPETTLADLVHEHVLGRGLRSLPVVADGRLLGMVTLNEIRQVPRDRWEETPVSLVMTGTRALLTAKPDDDLATAVKMLAEHDVNQLPVVEDGRMVGLLSRGHVIRFLEIREQLGLQDGGEERRAA